MCEFSGNVALDKVTNGQTDTKHEIEKILSSMSLLEIVGAKLPPSERSSLENHFQIEFGKSFSKSLSKLDHCEGGSFLPTFFNSDIELSVFPISCFIKTIMFVRLSLFRRQIRK